MIGLKPIFGAGMGVNQEGTYLEDKAKPARPTSRQKRAYHKYLESDEWIKLRCDIITLRGDRCEICGKRGVQVHHVTYDNIGHETADDLVLLCSLCHRKVHGLVKVKKKRVKRKKKPKLSMDEKRELRKKYKRDEKIRMAKYIKRICPQCGETLKLNGNTHDCTCGYSQAVYTGTDS